ncbi:hypothetical protein RJ640_029374 [Escallonia rubra]|uniref:Trichome birefringence-like N-terminal domain-containing protein n=1 Tax=Escallonia rubra TaxID=112253 RepID=A0AA88RHL2_9ASTE|nr:hypothetical protein RJ640_029374 [Escallonia rubra]
MADGKNQAAPINGGTLLSDLKSLFSLFRTKGTVNFAYGFMSAFILFTVFLAFNASPNSTASPWFSSISTSSSTSITGSTTNISSSTTPPVPSNTSSSLRSQISNIFSYLLPNSTSNSTSAQSATNVTRSENTTLQEPNLQKEPTNAKKQTQTSNLHDKVEAFNPNQTKTEAPKAPVAAANKTENSASKILPESGKNVTAKGDKGIAEKGSNLTSSLVKKQGNENSNSNVKQGMEELVKGLVNCDVFDGEWVRDDSYPLYKPGSCALIDEQFNCFRNGRPDKGYQHLKWKPKDCTLPRGKRLAFVGDSLNRNMWESLVCILRNSVKDQRKVYEASGRHHFRSEASYSFVFKDYNCTIEFFVSPFLVQEWEVTEKDGSKKETLRLDMIERSSANYKNADIIIFNTGHWWTHDKTSKGKDYYQEGSHVYGELDVQEAFRKALTTWGRWVDAHINPSRTLVFFRGYSASHFSGGQWNSGGQCDHETEPIRNKTYLSEYPSKMRVLDKVLKGMKTRVSYLNITRLTDYRKDGHPSIYRKQHYTEEERKSPLTFQDCSHWCLPGVPDAWNELLYAELLVKQYQNRRQPKRP